MRLLDTIHPTENQKRVMAKIIAAPTSTVAAHEIAGSDNLVAARNILMKLGIITFADDKAALTDKGQQISTEENIADETGQLTDMGKKLAYTDPNEHPDNDMTGQQPGVSGMNGPQGLGAPPPPQGLGGGLGGMGGMSQPSSGPTSNQLSLESFVVLRDLLQL